MSSSLSPPPSEGALAPLVAAAAAPPAPPAEPSLLSRAAAAAAAAARAVRARPALLARGAAALACAASLYYAIALAALLAHTAALAGGGGGGAAFVARAAGVAVSRIDAPFLPLGSAGGGQGAGLGAASAALDLTLLARSSLLTPLGLSGLDATLEAPALPAAVLYGGGAASPGPPAQGAPLAAVAALALVGSPQLRLPALGRALAPPLAAPGAGAGARLRVTLVPDAAQAWLQAALALVSGVPLAPGYAAQLGGAAGGAAAWRGAAADLRLRGEVLVDLGLLAPLSLRVRGAARLRLSAALQDLGRAATAAAEGDSDGAPAVFSFSRLLRAAGVAAAGSSAFSAYADVAQLLGTQVSAAPEARGVPSLALLPSAASYLRLFPLDRADGCTAPSH
jgi:hypothetical protein